MTSPKSETVTMVSIPRADYEALIVAAKADDMIGTCSSCGAWINRDDPAWATVEDFDGRWFAATYRQRDAGTCKQYRSPERAEIAHKALIHNAEDAAAMAARQEGFEASEEAFRTARLNPKQRKTVEARGLALANGIIGRSLTEEIAVQPLFAMAFTNLMAEIESYRGTLNRIAIGDVDDPSAPLSSHPHQIRVMAAEALAKSRNPTKV